MATPDDLRMTEYFVGVDLGQAADYTAITITQQSAALNRHEANAYDVRHIERLPLGTRYPAVVDRVGHLIGGIEAQHQLRRPIGRFDEPDWKIWLPVDQTGVGRAVVDIFKGKDYKAQLVPITITGGDSVSEPNRNEYRVPKRDLASVIQALLQAGKLRIAEDLPLTKTLTAELLNFRATISLSGHDSYAAGADWREGNHDDLVLSLAMGLWLAEHERTKRAGSGGYSRNYLQHPLYEQAIEEGWRFFPDGTPVEADYSGFHNGYRTR